jgi:hypothetical protein
MGIELTSAARGTPTLQTHSTEVASGGGTNQKLGQVGVP